MMVRIERGNNTYNGVRYIRFTLCGEGLDYLRGMAHGLDILI